MLYVEIVIAATKTKQHSYAARSAGRAFFCLPTPVATTWQWTGTCRNAMPFANSEVHGYIVLQAMLLLKAFITATLKRYTDKKKGDISFLRVIIVGKSAVQSSFLTSDLDHNSEHLLLDSMHSSIVPYLSQRQLKQSITPIVHGRAILMTSWAERY